MKVLVSAYACEPDRGSEGGAGWNWVVAAARNHEVLVLTRANNQPAIDEALARAPEFRSSLTFAYLDLPFWARFWKRGGLGVRVYYVLWQVLVARRVRELERRSNFDVVHHLTLANIYLPALACRTSLPFVLGPVAGGQRVPPSLYGVLRARATIVELLLLGSRLVSRWNPLVRSGWRRADIIVVNNEETRAALPGRHRRKAVLRSSACVETLGFDPREERRPGNRPRAACAGRLSPFKGIPLAIRALRHAPAWELTVIGSGPEEALLRGLARRERVADRVAFVPTLPQQALWRELAGANALVMPSLKEGASFVAAEAQALGVPVVALDQGGPAALARFPGARFELVPVGTEDECVQGFAAALRRLECEPPHAPSAEFGLAGVARDIDLIYRLATDAAGTEWTTMLAGKRSVIEVST